MKRLVLFLLIINISIHAGDFPTIDNPTPHIDTIEPAEQPQSSTLETNVITSQFEDDTITYHGTTTTLQKALIATAVLTIPFAIVKIMKWWEERTIHAMNDVQLLGEIQKRLYQYQKPFEYTSNLIAQREDTTAPEDRTKLTQELKTTIINFTDTTSYRFLKFHEKLTDSIENITVLRSWVHERFETITEQHKTSLRDVEDRINQILIDLTRLRDFVQLQPEFDEDRFNNLQDNTEYEPNYL